jgi:hypothetical protein
VQNILRVVVVGFLVFPIKAATAQTRPSSAYPNGDPLHIWVGNPDPPKARAWVNAHLAAAEAEVDKRFLTT